MQIRAALASATTTSVVLGLMRSPCPALRTRGLVRKVTGHVHCGAAAGAGAAEGRGRQQWDFQAETSMLPENPTIKQ